MKVKPFREEVIQLALDFIEKQLQEPEIAKKLKQKHITDIPQWILNNNQLLQKGLIKVVKSFAQQDKKIKQYYTGRKEEVNNDSSEQEEVPKKKQKNSKKQEKVRKMSEEQEIEVNQKPSKKKAEPSKPIANGHSTKTSQWVKNKFEAPQQLEEIGKNEQKSKIAPKKVMQMVPKEASSDQSEDRPVHEQQESESEPAPKKVVKKTVEKKSLKKKQSSSEQSESESEQVKKPNPKDKKAVKQQKIKSKIEQQNQEKKKECQMQEQPKRMRTRSQDKIEENEKPKKYYSGQSSFSRINPDKVGPIPQALNDNSFHAKFKYGKGGDQQGKSGYQRLKDTRGDSFKKTKDKMKNKVYLGGAIDVNVINSIPLD